MEQVEIGNLNLEPTQGPSPWPSLEMPPMDRVKSWDSTTELANELPSPPVDERLVPPSCIYPPLCPQVDFESVTILEFPWHGQPF